MSVILGAILLFLLPGTLISSYGFTGMMTGMVLAVVLLAPALSWLPRSGSKQPEQLSWKFGISEISRPTSREV